MAEELSSAKEVEVLSNETKNMSLLEQINDIKIKANEFLKLNEFEVALSMYEEALNLTTDDMNDEKCALYSNIGLAYYKLKDYSLAISNCSEALKIQPKYTKLLLRRAICYEQMEDFENALCDHRTIIEIDPTIEQSHRAIKVIEVKQQQKMENMKNELFTNLKNLANPFLNKFGLSTDSFKVEKNPETGGYSVKLEKD